MTVSRPFGQPGRPDSDRPMLLAGPMAAPLAWAGQPCVEALNITDPRAVRAAHDRYIAAGAAVLRTNTAGASPERLDRYRMHDEAFIVSYLGAEHARDRARRAEDADGVARWVLGMARIEARAPHLGFLPLDRVRAAARTMVSGLAGGGADLVLVEAGQDPARLLAAVEGARHGMADSDRAPPLLLKLRYDPFLAHPAFERVTHDLTAAACLCAGFNVAALGVSPVNLAEGLPRTLRAMASVYPGPLFAESADLAALDPLLRDPVLGPRLAVVGGGASPADTERLRALLQATAPGGAFPVPSIVANDRQQPGPSHGHLPRRDSR